MTKSRLFMIAAVSMNHERGVLAVGRAAERSLRERGRRERRVAVDESELQLHDRGRRGDDQHRQLRADVGPLFSSKRRSVMTSLDEFFAGATELPTKTVGQKRTLTTLDSEELGEDGGDCVRADVRALVRPAPASCATSACHAGQA